MIEKACGPIPLWMAKNAHEDLEDVFNVKEEQKE